MEHFYTGSRNVWYGEQLHQCNCGLESHDKAVVDGGTEMDKQRVIKGLDEVVKHLVDQCDRNELSTEEFAELNGYLHAAIVLIERLPQ